MMAGWTEAKLEWIAAAEELEIAPRMGGGALRGPTTVGVIRHGDDLYIWSYRGPTGSWYQAAQQTHAGRITAAASGRTFASSTPATTSTLPSTTRLGPSTAVRGQLLGADAPPRKRARRRKRKFRAVTELRNRHGRSVTTSWSGRGTCNKRWRPRRTDKGADCK
jgi:Uncharacterized protein conserved in bacteria (DUF2255)